MILRGFVKLKLNVLQQLNTTYPKNENRIFDSKSKHKQEMIASFEDHLCPFVALDDQCCNLFGLFNDDQR